MKKITSGNIDDKQKQDLIKLKDKISKEPQEKKKVGRPPKPKEEEKEPILSPLPPSIDFEPDFIITILAKLPFERLAKERGDHWKLTSDEEAKLKELLNKLIAKYSKYIPQWLIKYNLEITGLLFIGNMLNRRLQIDRNLKEEKEKEKSQQETPQSA